MLTGFNSFPSIFFGHEHIGGLADLQGLISENTLSETMLRNGIDR
jgi:glutaredoxin